MSLRRTLATTCRILQQLRHDPRTIGLILFVPSVLIIILRYVFDDAKPLFDMLAPNLLALFPFVVMFLVTSVAMLRERTTGTLERLMTLPMSKLDLLLGYALAFGLLSMIQSGLACLVMLGWLGVTVEGGTLAVLVVAVLVGLLGMAMGLFASAFAATEFQAVQFMPAIVFPQLLVCGLLAPRESMATILRWLANVTPLPYAIEAMKTVTNAEGWPSLLMHDVIVISAFTIAALMLAAITLRRQS